MMPLPLPLPSPSPSLLPNGPQNYRNNRNLLSLGSTTMSERKLRCLNYLLLLFRVASFSFSLASAIFTLSNSTSYSSLNFFSFRFLFAANAIVAVYSLFQMGAATWKILKGQGQDQGPTLLPLRIQLLFDFWHDQVFAYLELAAAVAGAAEAATLRQRQALEMGMGMGPSCQSFCIQADIGVALAFAGFLFVALATLASAFRLVSFLATGSPLLLPLPLPI
jgi:Domain of unknown function (DUF588)